MGNPWIKFYPRDWRGDQALRAVSLAARGLWMEMLCIMHEAQPYGHLILGGQPVSNDVLARVSGAGVDECVAMMAELESAGVLYRTRKGIIYSRRMVKDKQRSETGRKSVIRRWSQSAEDKEEKAAPNRGPNRKPTTQKPEARYDTNVSPPQASAADRLWSDGLDFLKSHGLPEKQARSMLGKWRKAMSGAGGDGALLDLLGQAQCNEVLAPLPWMEAAVKKRAEPVDDRLAYLRRRYGEAANV